jgi:dipeptidyl aminopeptidase/acylaminoacyl peptidase
MRHYLIPLLLTVSALTGPVASAEQGQRIVNDGNVVLDAVPEIPPRISNQLSRYQNVRGASFRAWSEDSTSLYVTTRFGETSQIHHVARAGGARRQLTFFDEPIGGVDRQPGGSLLNFTMDEGGSEFYQVFLFDPVTGGHRRLTDGSSRNGAVTWGPDGRRIAFQSTRRNGRSNDIWAMDVDDPDSARMVFESPDGTWWGPVDWSTDGTTLLVQQYVSVTDSRVHLVDVESLASRQVLGDAESPHVYSAETFTADGSGFYVLTDQDSEFSQLARFDLSSSDLEILTDDLPWDVDAFELSEDGRRGAFEVNEGGISRVYLMDMGTHEYRRVGEIPIGLAYGLTFSPDGSQLAMALNTARTPMDTFTLALGDSPLDYGELTRWTYSEVGGLDTESFVEPELIHYPTFDEKDGEPRQIPAFVYRPTGPGPHPVIVYIHGGPEGQYTPGFSSTFQMWVAELGAAVVAPNVRGSSGYGRDYVMLDNGFKREDSVKDIGALLDWITTQRDLDGERVAVYGGSYGGYMVLASLMHYSDRLKAGVDIVGISNFVTFLENTQDYRRDLRRVEYGDERDPKMREHLERISPNNNADRISAPLFVAQGQNDPRVPVTESEQVVRSVREAGYDVWYMNALNEGHGFRKKENRDLYQEVVMLFFETHLLGE